MSTTFEALQRCVQEGIIDSGQALRLAEALPADRLSSSQHREAAALTKVFYYLGGFLIVFAVTYFLGTHWEEYSDAQRITISGAIVLFFGVWGAFAQRSPYRVGGGLLLLVSSCTMPLLIYSVERATGLWPAEVDPTFGGFLGTVNSAWIILDTLSLLSACLMFIKFREPILTLPIAHFVWFFALDIGDLVHIDGDYTMWTSLHYRTQITILAGGLLVAWGIWYSARRDTRVGVWPWVYGLLMILGGILSMRWQDYYAAANPWLTYQLLFAVACLFIAPALRSRTFTTFGAIALFIYLQDIWYFYYYGSMNFSISLAAIGVLSILAGMLLQSARLRREGAIGA